MQIARLVKVLDNLAMRAAAVHAQQRKTLERWNHAFGRKGCAAGALAKPVAPDGETACSNVDRPFRCCANSAARAFWRRNGPSVFRYLEYFLGAADWFGRAGYAACFCRSPRLFLESARDKLLSWLAFRREEGGPGRLNIRTYTTKRPVCQAFNGRFP